MRGKRAGWLCALCEEKGRRAPVFRSMDALVKHSEHVHKVPHPNPRRAVEVSGRRVWLQG